MAYVPTKLYQGQPGTSETILYPVASGKTAIIKQVILCNTTGTAATISIGTVSSAVSNRFLQAYSVGPNSTVVLDLTLIVNATEIVTGLQGTSSAISVHISGVIFP